MITLLSHLEMADIKCVVCDDENVVGHAFGVISCEGCKAFFSRNRTRHQIYKCKESGNCPINKETRKDCRYCRYAKCLEKGMREVSKRSPSPRATKEKTGSMPNVLPRLELHSASEPVALQLVAGTRFEKALTSSPAPASKSVPFDVLSMPRIPGRSSNASELHERSATSMELDLIGDATSGSNKKKSSGVEISASETLKGNEGQSNDGTRSPEFENLDISSMEANNNLDGFQILPVGFPPNSIALAKILKLINIGNGTRCDKMSSRVTHVITSDLIKNLKDFSGEILDVAELINAVKGNVSKTDEGRDTLTTATESSQLFKGISFKVQGYDQEKKEEIEQSVKEHGGAMNDKCNYTIVPPLLYEHESVNLKTSTTYATCCWLRMCVELEEILPFNVNILYKPLIVANVAETSLPLRNFVITLGPLGAFPAEMEALVQLIRFLGGTHQASLSRKSQPRTTHFITKVPEERILKAALSWKIKVVKVEWLYAIAKSGKFVEETAYAFKDKDSHTEGASVVGRYPRKVFLFSTSYDDKLLEKMISIVEQLGGKALNDRMFNNECTHMVAEKLDKREKFLSSIAAGKIIIHDDFIFDSAEAGKFVEEDKYVIGSPMFLRRYEFTTIQERAMTAIYRWYQNFTQTGKGAFADWCVILMAPEDKRAALQRVLEAGGATIVKSAEEMVSSKVRLAFLENSETCPVEDYMCEDLMKNQVWCLLPRYFSQYLRKYPRPDFEEHLFPAAQKYLHFIRAANVNSN